MALDEKAIIVDENDNILEYKTRSEITINDRMRTVVVWLEDDKGNVLIHKRSMTKKAGPGRWENAAGGGVAHNQSYEQAAYAELEEEIGVTGVKLEYVAKTIVITPHGERMCGGCRGTTNLTVDKFILEPGEVDEIKWIDKQELFELRDKDPEAYMPSSSYWRELFSD